jgi:putative spermidine/putrescine transport system ATP-binding protein
MFLSVEALTKRYAGVTALSAASFSADKGEVLALLGPSGCGKTTLLNLIAGFLTPDGGRICVGGRDLTGVPPNRRDMGMVFQSYALFPHLTVARNVAFGLEARGIRRAESQARIADALDRVGLAEFGPRYPHALSGGQQQRIALARALVVRPSILLLDEPLSNLDTQLRREMAEDIREILRGAGMTAVLVTHDPEEALVIADRVLLMSSGRIEQIGTPEDVFERPSTLFGARFMEAMNFIEGVILATDDQGVTVDTRLGRISAGPCDAAVGTRVTVMVRPERVCVIPAEAPDEPAQENRIGAEVLRANYHGTYRRLHVTAGSQALTIDIPVSGVAALPGAAVRLAWCRDDTHVLVR